MNENDPQQSKDQDVEMKFNQDFANREMKENNNNNNKDINIINGNDPNQSKNQNAEIKFNQDLANQEWINEKNFLRMAVLSVCMPFAFESFVNDVSACAPIANDNSAYFLNQDKFVQTLPLGKVIYSIDTFFANNVQFMFLLEQKYFVVTSDVRNLFFTVFRCTALANTYVRAMLEEKLANNKEIKRFIAACDIEDVVTWVVQLNEGLNSTEISLDERKKFNEIVNDFFNLPDSFMQRIDKLYLKHKNYSNTFYTQGETYLHFNLNYVEENIHMFERDFVRNTTLRDKTKKANSRRWETLSYYSRHMILCFFGPEYLYADKKPDSKLVEFYVALNSLLSVTEKENAKAILNSDDKKLTEQQKGLKKELSGEDEKLRNNIINAWKGGFFLDKSKIEESDNLFKDKEKKFRDAFYKNRAIDLIIEIENGNLKLMSQGQNKDLKNDLSSKDNNDDKINFLIEKLFSGAGIFVKNNNKFLTLTHSKCAEYSSKDLSEKLTLIDTIINELPPKTVLIYDENKGLVKIIDWLISEIENGNLNLIPQDQNKNLKNGLSIKNNNNEKINFLIEQLFSGASVVDKNENDITYLKLTQGEIDKYSRSDLDEKLKLIDNKIQSCPKAAKILKPSDFILNVYDYQHLRKERLSELLYFKDDKQKRDYIYLRENKDYYRDYILHQDYGENELYNKLYQCTKKADFGKYKREHFIFDKTGTIIGMDVFAYFADKIVDGELILKNDKYEDISNEAKNIDNDLAREVFLMDKLKLENGAYSIFDNESNKFQLDADSMQRYRSIVENLETEIKNLATTEYGKYEANENTISCLFDNLSSNDEKDKTMKDFIKMFRLEQKDVCNIVKVTCKTNALVHRYALNKIFTEKINPINRQNEKLIGSYVFDFSKTGCERDDLVFSKDGRVEYVKSECLPRVLKLDETKTLELQARNDFIKNCNYEASNNKELQKAKAKYEKYQVSKEDLSAARDGLKNLRANLDSNACANLSDFYDFDSYRDEFLDEYIKFYQNAKIGYEYWCSECAQKFLKDKKAKEVKSDNEIADIELKFLKGQKIEQKDLSQYTKDNKQQEIADIELKLFEGNKIKFNDLSQYTKNNKEEKIIEIEFELLKENKLKGNISPYTKKNLTFQKQKYKLTQISYRLGAKKINNQNELEEIVIDGETVLYSSKSIDNQQLNSDINDLKRQNINLYKSNNIPYKHWDSDAKEDYFDKLQWKWFGIGCIPLVIFILFLVFCCLTILESYLVVKIILTVVFFVLGCLAIWKGIKNNKDCDYDGPDTYDNPNYSYPNDNFVETDLNFGIQGQNTNLNILKKNLNIDLRLNENINTNIGTSSHSRSTQSQEENISGLDLGDKN